MTKKLTQEEFITRARKVHGDKYDYSKVIYVNANTNVVITCPTHGDFKQTPARHLLGCDCLKCELKKRKHRPHYKERTLVQGVGVVDIEESTTVNQKIKKAHKTWSAMILRCYTKKTNIRQKYPSYDGCTVCDEWHYFSNFLKWFDKNYIEGYCLDKDILVKGNKVYSPSTCCYIPYQINNILSSHKRIRGNLPIGVVKLKRKHKEVYCSQMNYVLPNGRRKNVVFGFFDNPYSAFKAYKNGKEEYIKNVAKKYYNQNLIGLSVYEALVRYKIDIND